ncbi:proline-rich protein 5-like [Limulus polyphemus]|uniref:Proline-rich protein 5-like n=1 Tax=Limulus polyphemus TaxID=6850 RepID=A0ABM1STH3_LIMPO|nr:proline-rich protein 5-like [Limulus polyphemus]
MHVSNRRSPWGFYKTTNAISLHSVQALGIIATPRSIRQNGASLPVVPENGELSSIDIYCGKEQPPWQRAISGRKNDWDVLQKATVGLFQRQKPVLEAGELAKLHETIRKLQNSYAGPFIYEYYKQKILSKGMSILRDRIRQSKGKRLTRSLEEVWGNIFVDILPLLDAILFLVKTREGITIRQTTLAAFRDQVVLKLNIEDALSSEAAEVPLGVKHMLLILYNVNDVFPPNKNKLRLESLLARTIVPFLGFKGLYCGNSMPLIESSEPQLIAKRRSNDGGRRISRPFSIQPCQLDTLNEMFLTALRKQQE